jgi:hypothetical protein
MTPCLRARRARPRRAAQLAQLALSSFCSLTPPPPSPRPTPLCAPQPRFTMRLRRNTATPATGWCTWGAATGAAGGRRGAACATGSRSATTRTERFVVPWLGALTQHAASAARCAQVLGHPLLRGARRGAPHGGDVARVRARAVASCAEAARPALPLHSLPKPGARSRRR